MNETNKIRKEIIRETVNFQRDNFNTLKRLEKFKNIIDDTIKEYNYNGSNFHKKYLPVIISLALEKYEKELIEQATIRQDNIYRNKQRKIWRDWRRE
jgi:hypothetical protein